MLHILRRGQLLDKKLLLQLKTYATEVTINLTDAFKLHCLEDGPSSSVKLSNEDATKYYTQMQLIRRMETASDALYKEKLIRGFCHLYSGEEAVCVGVKSAMRDQDSVITAYRCHGWSYVMKIPVKGILAELLGRKTGVMRGKGGSMHMYAPNFYGGNGIVGAQVPLGAGVSLSNKYKGDGGVTFAFYGDGAANQGQVFEAYNMAYLWKLPCIFVCENNNYGMGTAANRSSSSTDFYTRGDYIPGIWVDGMNILAVRSAAKFAIEYAAKNGPLVIEAYTYRYSGHSMSDPGTSYRSREEVQEVRQKRDPITKFRALCLENGLLKEDEIKNIDTSIQKEIDGIVEKIRLDPEVDLKELTADIYSNNLEPMIRGTTGYKLQHIQINRGATKPKEKSK